MKNIIRKNKGFTLIEVMIVIAVIAILTGAFTSSMIRWLPDYRLNSSAIDLRLALQQTRLAAVKNNADIIFDFDVFNLPSQVELTEVVDMPAQVTFNSRGFPDNSGEIHMKNSRGTHKGIRMTLSGNCRIIRSIDSGATWQ